MQVAEAIHKYDKGSSLTVVPLYGGAPMDQQIRALMRGASIVVATPGRALDHMRRETLDLSALEVLVLDEADEMLDLGFLPDIEKIMKMVPQSRQTLLFSATMPTEVLKLTREFLHEPKLVQVGRRGGPAQARRALSVSGAAPINRSPACNSLLL